MRFRLAGFCLLLATFAQTQVSQRPPAMAAALAELSQGKVYEAIDKLKRIVRDDLASAPAYFYLSSLYTEMGHYEIAHRYIEQAIHIDGERGSYLHQLGIIRYREGSRPEALAHFEKALKLGMGADEGAAWRNIGEVHADLLNWDDALRAYENALRIQPKDARSRLALGQFYLDRNNPERAVSELRAAVEISPALSGAHSSLGRAYRQLGDLAAAADILRKGLELDSSNQESRYVLGQVLMEMGRVAEGRKELEEYRRVQELISRVDTIFNEALDRVHAGELAAAEKLLENAIDLAPDYGPALHTLGAVLLERGDPRRAAELLKGAVAVNPLQAGAYFTLGAANLRTGKLREALEATERAIVLYGDDARYHGQMGQIYLKLGRPEEARNAFAKAGELGSRRQPDPYDTGRRRRNE